MGIPLKQQFAVGNYPDGILRKRLSVEAMLGNYLRSLFNKVFIGVFISALGVSVAVADEQGDAAANSARAVVDSLHNQLFAVASNPTLSFAERSDQLAPVVEASYDFKYISRFILRRSWAGLEPIQQEKFISAILRLSVANYANRFAEIEEQSLVITGASAATGKRVQVDARLQSDEFDLTLSYTLTGKEENWMIVNLIADGVSDLALRRAEYSRVLKDKGFEALLVHIDKQIAKLK